MTEVMPADRPCDPGEREQFLEAVGLRLLPPAAARGREHQKLAILGRVRRQELEPALLDSDRGGHERHAMGLLIFGGAPLRSKADDDVRGGIVDAHVREFEVPLLALVHASSATSLCWSLIPVHGFFVMSSSSIAALNIIRSTMRACFFVWNEGRRFLSLCTPEIRLSARSSSQSRTSLRATRSSGQSMNGAVSM